jgi:hypothetical protein
VNARELRLSDADLLRERSRQLAAREQHDKRVRVKAAPRVKAKAQDRQARNERIAEIRTAAFKAWQGLCAICSPPVPATDLHHVLSGPDRRRRESAETVLPVCRLDHHRLHAGDLMALEDAMLACKANGMIEAATALERRIAKVEEARRAA